MSSQRELELLRQIEQLVVDRHALRTANATLTRERDEAVAALAVYKDVLERIRTARKEAYERAAKVMDDLGVARQNLGGTTDLNMQAARQFFIGAAAIRKLGDENGPG